MFVTSVRYVHADFGSGVHAEVFFCVVLVRRLLVVLFVALRPGRFRALSALLLVGSTPVLSRCFTLADDEFSGILFILSYLMFVSLAFLCL